jgi:hypothetical protein
LSTRVFTDGDFTGPRKRQIRWGTYEKDDTLLGTFVLDLLVEFERLPRGVSPNVEHYEVIDPGLPKRSRCGDLFGSMHFDSMTPQDARSHPTGSLAAIDEENFLVIENRAAREWWLVHPAPPKLERPLWRGDSSGLCSRKEGKSTAMEKSLSRPHETFLLEPCRKFALMGYYGTTKGGMVVLQPAWQRGCLLASGLCAVGSRIYQEVWVSDFAWF